MMGNAVGWNVIVTKVDGSRVFELAGYDTILLKVKRYWHLLIDLPEEEKKKQLKALLSKIKKHLLIL